jgi:hypothetical protein
MLDENMKKPIKISYSSMWPKFNHEVMPQDYFFEFVLSQKYQVLYCDQDPDVIIYSVFGPSPDISKINPKTLVIAYSGEPFDVQGPADIVFGFHGENQENYFRLPIWALWIHWDNQPWKYKLTETSHAGQGSHHVATSGNYENSSGHPMRLSNILKRHTNINHADKFCNFTYARNSRERVEFFLLLNQKKKVDSTGKLFNNAGYYLGSKPHDLSSWRFTLAFENTQLPGYVTEKLIEPLAAGSIPIYWGGNKSIEDFNPDSFINTADFSDWSAAIDWIMHVENTPSLQQKYLQAPVFKADPCYPQQVFSAIYNKLILKNPALILDSHDS